MRRIFIILGLLILILFFVTSNVNAVTPVQTPPRPTAASPIPTAFQTPPRPTTPPIAIPAPPPPGSYLSIECSDENSQFCLTTQPCRDVGCRVYNCNERNGNYFCDSISLTICQNDRECLYPQPCDNNTGCKEYNCSETVSGTAVLCVLPISAEPEPPPPPCANGLDENNHETRDQSKIKKCLAVNTALGEIKTSPEGFIKSIFSLILGVSGGIALLLIIYSGYQLMASRGEPEALKTAKDQLVAAIIGLVFIIFSLVILQIIGVDILKIPGFEE